MNFYKGVVVAPDDFIGVDWLTKMKDLELNVLGIHSGEGQGINCMERLKNTADLDFQQNILDSGINYEYELHTGSSLLPRGLFDECPEYFAFDSSLNKRTDRCNWCSSSDEAMRIVCENAVKMAERLAPSTHRYFFWGDDAAGWCHCEKCKHLNDADQELLVSNHLAKALTSVDPKAQVAFLAFEKTLKKPFHIKPEENVFMEYAPMRRCYNHAIDDASCAINREHLEILESLFDLFPPEKVHILEYWLDSSLFSNYQKPARKPLFINDVVRRDIKRYSQMGIRSITSFAVYMDGEYFKNNGDDELKFYAEQLAAANV